MVRLAHLFDLLVRKVHAQEGVCLLRVAAHPEEQQGHSSSPWCPEGAVRWRWSEWHHQRRGRQRCAQRGTRLQAGNITARSRRAAERQEKAEDHKLGTMYSRHTRKRVYRKQEEWKLEVLAAFHHHHWLCPTGNAWPHWKFNHRATQPGNDLM